MSRRARALANRSYPWTGLEPDRRNAILLIGGISFVVLLALVLIGYGYYSDRIAPKHETVLTVGDRKFDYAFLERRGRAELIQGRLDTSNLAQSLFQLLLLVERQETTRQAAKSLGVTMSDEEIEARYRQRLNLPANASRELLASRLRSELLRTGLSLSEYRETAAAELLDRKLRAQFETTVPVEAEHVALRLIQTQTQADALQAKERLDQGELFGRVALDLSVHPSTRETGGNLSWTPRGALPKQVEDAAFALDAGARSDVIETDDGFFIVQSDGEETRAVSGDGKLAIVQRSLDNLLVETRQRVGATVTMTPAQLQRLALSLSSPVG